MVAAVLTLGRWHALRHHLRERLYDGADHAAPCDTQADVSLCFAPLLRWLLSWWQGDELALAVNTTAHGDVVVALVVGVLYRGSAIPVACRQRADRLVPGPGHAWVGRGIAVQSAAKRRQGTLVVVWEEGHAEPWAVLTDLAPDRIGVAWYGVSVWVELGFRALKGLG